MKTSSPALKSWSTLVSISFFPVRWKLANDLDMFKRPPLGADELASWLLLRSRERDLVMMSVDFGLPCGIAEWGKMFDLMGVTSMCSVQLVSKTGFWIRSTSTFRLRCSNGQEKVSGGNDWSQESKERSLSLNSLWLKMFVNSIEFEFLLAVAFCWQ